MPMGNVPTRTSRSPIGQGEHRPRAPRPRAGDEPLDALHEVPPVAVGLEADQVVLQERAQHLRPPRQLQEDVQGRERDVQEEAHQLRGSQRPELPAHEHQVVVVHPQEVLRARAPHGDRGEAPVDLLVGLPRLGVVDRAGGQIVKERPEGPVGEPLVVELDLLLAERHGHQLVAHRPGRRRERTFDVLQLAPRAGPSDPHPAPVPQHRRESGDETPDPRPRDGPAAAPLEDDRQPVRDGDEAELLARLLAVVVALAGHRSAPAGLEGATAFRCRLWNDSVHVAPSVLPESRRATCLPVGGSVCVVALPGPCPGRSTRGCRRENAAPRRRRRPRWPPAPDSTVRPRVRGATLRASRATSSESEPRPNSRTASKIRWGTSRTSTSTRLPTRRRSRGSPNSSPSSSRFDDAVGEEHQQITRSQRDDDPARTPGRGTSPRRRCRPTAPRPRPPRAAPTPAGDRPNSR